MYKESFYIDIIFKKLAHMCLCFIARLAKLLKDEERGQLSNALPKRDFEIAYKLDCIWEFCMILEYFSLRKGPFTGL
jgi:hypothetical protein